MNAAAPEKGGGGAGANRRTVQPGFSTTSAAAGQDSCRRLGVICAEIVTNIRRQRHAEHLYRLGARPVLEALVEVGTGRPLDTVLAEYGRLDADIVTALGGDDFPPQPLHEVRR